MRKITLMASALLLAASAFAGQTALKLSMLDGSTFSYVLEDKPVITMEGENVNIATSDASASFKRADVKNFVFVDEPSGIEEITRSESFISYDGRSIAASGVEISVYSLSGSRVAVEMESVNVESLPAGTYIATAGSRSLKFIKK